MYHSTKENDDFYKNLDTRLNETHTFPGEYVYKFIIPNDNEKLNQITDVFSDVEHCTETKQSSNLNYISCTVKIQAQSSSQIIDLYKEVGKINGVIML